MVVFLCPFFQVAIRSNSMDCSGIGDFIYPRRCHVSWMYTALFLTPTMRRCFWLLVLLYNSPLDCTRRDPDISRYLTYPRRCHISWMYTALFLTPTMRRCFWLLVLLYWVLEIGRITFLETLLFECGFIFDFTSNSFCEQFKNTFSYLTLLQIPFLWAIPEHIFRNTSYWVWIHIWSYFKFIFCVFSNFLSNSAFNVVFLNLVSNFCPFQLFFCRFCIFYTWCSLND